MGSVQSSTRYVYMLSTSRVPVASTNNHSMYLEQSVVLLDLHTTHLGGKHPKGLGQLGMKRESEYSLHTLDSTAFWGVLSTGGCDK